MTYTKETQSAEVRREWALNSSDYSDMIAELYQILGALDAPENVLDQGLACMALEQLPHKTLLPFNGGEV